MMKKFTKMAAVFLMALFVGLCIGNDGMEAKAAGLTQTDAQKTSLTVTWTADSSAVSYNVYLKEYSSDADYALVGNTPELTYTFNGLKPATKYNVRVISVEADGNEGYLSNTLYDAVTIPDKLIGLKQKMWWYWAKSLDVQWDRQDGASGYEIRLYDNKGKKKKSLSLSSYSSSTSFSIKNNIVYKVQARSYVTFKGQKKYSSWSTIYCLNQPMLKQVKLSGNKLQLKWDKVNGATQYQVYVSAKAKSGYKKVATVSKSKNSCTVKKFSGKKFSSKKKYYVYVEAICNKSNTKNSSGSLYYWNTKQGGGTSALSRKY
ncbi:MAG: fibronectin type III domain-containing protein [Roseburia sp.]|nr:fibronectin type III domain-containing protein [Roseburia sp.]